MSFINVNSTDCDVLLDALDGYRLRAVQHPADEAKNGAISRLHRQVTLTKEYNEVRHRLQQMGEERKKEEQRMTELQQAIKDCWEDR